jgi:thiol-disulfide isomerase/thioredoxin
MSRTELRAGTLAVCVAALSTISGLAQTAKPTPAIALALKPIQSDVDYDTPTGEEVAKCSVDAKTSGGGAGWQVLNSAGQLLRRFVDTNGDNKIDQWCYYKDGLEVYRDIDANNNGKADQYRWLGTAGIRWGLDEDEDGRIDRWKQISAEEVASEVVAALRTNDAARFRRLLLSEKELNALGLGAVQSREIAKKVAAAAQGFAELTQRQTVVGKSSEWLNFGASRPGVIPAGFEGSTRDLIVYDTASAIVATDGKHAQIVLGSLVQVEGGWRLIDLPHNGSDNQAGGPGLLQQLAPSNLPQLPSAGGGLDPKSQELIRQMEELDKALAKPSSPEDVAKLNTKRADLLEQLLENAATADERETWVRQYADTVSAAVQAGGYAEGVTRLKKLAEVLAPDAANAKLKAYVKYRYLTAVYSQGMQQATAETAGKVQDRWLADLQQFVDEYPRAEDAAEAMLHLAIGQEFAGKTEDAAAWYAKIVAAFPTAEVAKKAAGAKRRLESVGKPMSLQGTTLDGKTFSLASYRGRVVLIQYWATWCEPCKQEMALLKQLQAKYAQQGFAIVGINLDADRSAAVAFIRANPLPWPQVYEAGGVEASRLAQEMGIMTLPTMLLIDNEGKVLNRNVHAGELDEDLGKRLR